MPISPDKLPALIGDVITCAIAMPIGVQVSADLQPDGSLVLTGTCDTSSGIHTRTLSYTAAQLNNLNQSTVANTIRTQIQNLLNLLAQHAVDELFQG